MARWYDPGTGRFVSEDRYSGNIADPLSENRYVYASDNPLRYGDPTGQSAASDLAQLGKDLTSLGKDLTQLDWDIALYALFGWVTGPGKVLKAVVTTLQGVTTVASDMLKLLGALGITGVGFFTDEIDSGIASLKSMYDNFQAGNHPNLSSTDLLGQS